MMKPAKNVAVVLVTTPDLETARTLAREALAARLVACVNLLPQIESHYWWQGKLQTGAEVLMLLKTTTRNLAVLEKLILARHPYDTPEFVALPVHSATARYLEWWRQSAASPAPPATGS